MNTRLFLLAPLLLLILLFTGEAISSPTDSFTISSADAVVYLDTGGEPTLKDLIANVVDRFVVQFASELKYVTMVPAPGGLLTLLEKVQDRVVIQFANENRYYPFLYPSAIIADTSPPQISRLSTSSSGSISWATDEYTTSELHYGTQQGNYTHTLISPLYDLIHQFQLPGLVVGHTYYYIVICTDRSGNSTTSSEMSFTLQQVLNLYLPISVK
jgi:hypothetical protein